MEKNQYELCLKILRRLKQARVLEKITLVGSWTMLFYEKYFISTKYIANIRTRDIDFALQRRTVFAKKVNIPALIKDLGFITEFVGKEGYMRFIHPDLIIEFLVPEIGKGTDMPYTVSQLGINAQPLRYLSFLLDNTINVKFEELTIKLPHPAAYVLHKFIIFKRRLKKDKQDKDIGEALAIFKALVDNKNESKLKNIFTSMPLKWQKTIIKNLESINEIELAKFLM
ncbi:MAG: GSU2403 family nucleotidyltransferase fold protein [bacterium]